LYCRKYRNNF
jgi:hypothetical protein